MVLAGLDQPHPEFAGLVAKLHHSFVKIVLGFIHTDKGCTPALHHNGRPLLNYLGNEGKKEAAPYFTPVLLEKILAVVLRMSLPVCIAAHRSTPRWI
jgi:hypothetical protein